MIGCTGPPRIAGLEVPYASKDEWMQVEFAPASSVTREFEVGTVEVVEQRLRARFRCGWVGLAPAEASQLVVSLSTPAAEVVPRTKLPTDPSWSEETVLTMNLQGPVPTTAMLVRPDFPVFVTMVSVGTFTQLPGALIGAFVLEETYTTVLDGIS